MQKSNMKQKCPYHKIEIPADREIVETDDLKFPWKQDPYGYFLIKLENNRICCGFVNNNHVMEVEFRGTNPEKIIKEIAKRELVGLSQMGYIASELMIAKDCLENKKEYVQR